MEYNKIDYHLSIHKSTPKIYMYYNQTHINIFQCLLKSWYIYTYIVEAVFACKGLIEEVAFVPPET